MEENLLGRQFLHLAGDKSYELPPLLVPAISSPTGSCEMLDMAHDIVQLEDLVHGEPATTGLAESNTSYERRKYDLAINLVEQYLKFQTHWRWGDSILEWIRQCETTFEFTFELRNLMRPDVWPHASRSNFVTLLHDKSVEPQNLSLEKAVGARLTFREVPPIQFLSDHFLFLLNGTVAETAFRNWSDLAPPPHASFPPERFTFQVVNM